MDIAHIPGATRTVGESQGYFGLPLRDEPLHCTVNGPATPSMVTAWLPTPDEIAALMAGAAVYVRILGTAHPPIMLGVGPSGEGEENAPPAPVAVPEKKRAKMIANLVSIADASRREDGSDIPLGETLRKAADMLATPSPASPEKGTERLFGLAWDLVQAIRGGGPLPHRTPAEVADEAAPYLLKLRPLFAPLPAEPEGEKATIKATQISMGHGLVDVVDITHEGRKGILFHPRDHHLPIGGDGSIEPGPRWPGPEDVVIWIDDPRGAEVIQHYLVPFLPAARPNDEDRNSSGEG